MSKNLNICGACNGTGENANAIQPGDEESVSWIDVDFTCEACNGTGVHIKEKKRVVKSVMKKAVNHER